ncbi:hypothetical protein GX50_03465 [[Emmonsia] crescens]|uniref:Uncharacterized protein n=1 Tax=[Emmonsia] crescens TaxID=73230 RepID=A0A2B7ZJC0_9EURO|nr:hypothetical protein GX50_03465 [Emmonsia crescens]
MQHPGTGSSAPNYSRHSSMGYSTPNYFRQQYMPQVMVNKVIIRESVYAEMSESLTILLQQAQDLDSFTQERKTEVKEKDITVTDGILWTLAEDNVLRILCW